MILLSEFKVASEGVFMVAIDYDMIVFKEDEAYSE